MLLSSIRKEVLQLLADRGALASMFLMPLAFIIFFGFVFRGGGDGDDEGGRPLAVWHAAGDARAAGLVAALAESGAFEPELLPSADAVRAAVGHEEFLAGLIVPADLGPPDAPAVLVIDEGASPMVRGPIEGAVRGIVARAATGPRAGDEFPWVVSESPPGKRELLDDVGSFQITVPGNALLFSFFIAVAVALGFVEERRQGTFRRLLAAPVSRPKVLLAKLVPYFLVGLIQMAFLFGVGYFGFGMRIGGSVVALAAITAAAVFSAVALGLLIASFGGSEKQVGGFASLAVLVMGLLGGAMFPRLLMPDVMQTAGLFVPHGWGLDAYYDVLIRDGTTIADVAKPIAALCGFGVGFAAIGAARFKFE